MPTIAGLMRRHTGKPGGRCPGHHRPSAGSSGSGTPGPSGRELPERRRQVPKSVYRPLQPLSPGPTAPDRPDSRARLQSEARRRSAGSDFDVPLWQHRRGTPSGRARPVGRRGRGEKKDEGEPVCRATTRLGRSRGEHRDQGRPLWSAASDGDADLGGRHGRPGRFESKSVEAAMAGVGIEAASRGRPRRRPGRLACGLEGYGATDRVRLPEHGGIKAVIPTSPEGPRARHFDKAAYRRRNIAERCIGWPPCEPGEPPWSARGSRSWR